MLPSPLELKQKISLSASQKATIANCRKQAQEMLIHPDKLLIIVGPCSIHNIETALVYAKRLAKLYQEVHKSCYLVLRVYLEKPRTLSGWKGFIYQPDIKKPPNLYEGLILSRTLLREIVDLHLPIAMEFVDPLVSYYFDDLITIGCIGARTCASQIHRQLASSLSFPIGFKNSLDGNIDLALQGMCAAGTPQTFFSLSQEGSLCSFTSNGNPSTFLMLRGGSASTNYDLHSLYLAFEKQQQYGLTTPILIDCSHGNSKKNLLQQQQNFLQILEYKLSSSAPLLGMMLESFLDEGHQSLSHEINPRLSITDPCLSWETTHHLILWANQLLSQELIKTPN